MKSITLCFAIMLLSIVACADDNDELKNSIIKINKTCPQQFENWTLDSMGLSKKGEIVYFCNSTNNADYMTLLKSKKDSIRNELLDKINNNFYENSNRLIQLCKKNNAGLIYKFYSNKTKETIVIKIPVEKLITDPAK